MRDPGGTAVGRGASVTVISVENRSLRARFYAWPDLQLVTMFFKSDDKKKAPRSIPLLPLRDIIVFPHMVVPLFVGREKSINALEQATAGDKEIVLSAQKKAKTNDPTPEDIFTVGTIGQIIQLLRLPDGTVKVLVEGKRRVRLRRFMPNEECFL